MERFLELAGKCIGNLQQMIVTMQNNRFGTVSLVMLALSIVTPLCLYFALQFAKLFVK